MGNFGHVAIIPLPIHVLEFVYSCVNFVFVEIGATPYFHLDLNQCPFMNSTQCDNFYNCLLKTLLSSSVDQQVSSMRVG